MKNLFFIIATLAALNVFAAAPVNVVVHHDYECPYSKRHFDDLLAVEKIYGSRISIELVNFPLEFHPRARQLAAADVCARTYITDRMGFSAMLFALSPIDGPDATEVILGRAKLFRVDVDAFRACLTSPATNVAIDADLLLGTDRGVTGTPTTFVGDEVISGAHGLKTLRETIDRELISSR